jgi:Tol biopolymer transport system component
MPPAAGTAAAPDPTAASAGPVAGSPLASPYGPGQGYGTAATPPAGFGPAPAAPGAPAVPGPPAVPGSPAVPGPRPRRARRATTAAVALAVVAAAVAGVLVWHPWTSDAPRNEAKTGGLKPARVTTPGSPTPAPFPDVPLLVRVDTAPGWPTDCHAFIALRSSASGRVTRLASGSPCDFLPKWSPDRKTIAFTRRTAEDQSVWTVHADGTGARRVAKTSGGRVSWSPDGTKLAVLRKTAGVQQLFIVDASDGSAQQITTGDTRIEDPAWSPDGSRIAICVQKGTDNWQINLIDPTPGAEPQRITDLPRPALDPVWSPDGKLFAYTSGENGVGTQGDIRIIGTDGTGDRPLVVGPNHEMDPDWSPDGTWVAFVRGPVSTPTIWAIRADGTGERKVSTGAAPEGHPAWALKGGG